MKKITIILVALLIPIITMFGSAEFDVRVKIHDIDCKNAKLYVDLEIRAADAASTFNLADLNFRIALGAGLANPTIDQELFLNGIVFNDPTDPSTISFYGPHSLTGSIGDQVSYNVVLDGGVGYILDHIDYTPVGRIALDIIDFNECLDISWNEFPIVFPWTFIGEKLNGQLLHVTNGSFGDYKHCSYCNFNTAPETKRDKAVTPSFTPVQACVLNNDADIDGNLDPSSISIVAGPDFGTATVDASNCIVYTPTSLFKQDKLIYQVCDDGSSIPAVKGDDNPIPVTLPDPSDPNVVVSAPKCATNNLRIRLGRTQGGPIGQLPFTKTIQSDDQFAPILNIYPNPADQHITVQMEANNMSANKGTLNVYNHLGQTVASYELTQLNDSILRINTENWTPGIYVLSWYNSENQSYSTSKFVVAH